VEKPAQSYDQALNMLPADERVSRAVLVCKIGNTWRDAYHFEESLPFYTRALEILGEPPAEEGQAAQDWWQCWIQIQTEIINVNYWMSWIEKTDELKPQITQAVERYGTSNQQANVYQMLAASEFRRSRYSPSQQALVSIQKSVEAHRKAGSLEHNPSIRFMLGFVLFLNGALDEAEIELEAVVHQAEQRGDLSLLARCLTYLTLLNRKRGKLGSVIDLAGKALKTAESAQMPEYVGAARANLAWAAWRSSDFKRARDHCQAALDLWSQSPGVQAAAVPYYGTAIWPLLAIAAAEDDLPKAIEHARDLLLPNRKRMPDTLSVALSALVAGWEQGQDLRPAIIPVLALAEELQEF
jgi:eukaryotic-like serine/threonine-protein kinase